MRVMILILMQVLLLAQLAAATVWQRWERALTSSTSYGNPYADVTLRVTYSGPGGRTLETYGFWDGGSTFKIRAAFPVAGTWTWSTTCSDTANGGLHNRSGSVNVDTYSGSNPLYEHGLLKVSGDKHYLTYDDGTPFLWLADTAWIAPLNATLSDWKAFVDNRVQNGFTLIQIAPASAWGGETDTSGNAPFTSTSDIGRWNPSYWRGFDEKVQYANQQGLQIALIGVQEPTFRYPSTSEAERFARNIVARLYGNHVIFSPSFDSGYRSAGDKVGMAIDDATSVHLITQHPNTPYHPDTNTTAHAYHDQAYLDFSMNQSGHNSGDRDWCHWKAVHWNLALYDDGPRKPVINAEAFYEGDPAAGQEKYRGTAYDARALGWLSWGSGSLGYTYGVLGIWNWGKESGGVLVPWRTAMNRSSATHMKHLAGFYGKLAWWKLRPAHGRIRNQATDDRKLMVYAQAADNGFGVAYLPDNDGIRLDLGGFSGAVDARWFDPVDASYSSAGTGHSGVVTFTAPGSGDWVLLLEQGGGGDTAAPARPTGLTATVQQ